MKYKNYLLYLSIFIIVLATIRIILQSIYGSTMVGFIVMIYYFIGVVGVWGLAKWGYWWIIIAGLVELLASVSIFILPVFISGLVFLILGIFGLILSAKSE